MKQIILLLLVTTFTSTAYGQARGKILINGNDFEVPSGTPTRFEFNLSKTSLTNSGLKYLDHFGEVYRDKLLPTDTLIIALDPASTESESIKNRKIGLKRAKTVTKYIETKFEIKITKVRIRETVTTCELVAVPTRKGYEIKNVKNR